MRRCKRAIAFVLSLVLSVSSLVVFAPSETVEAASSYNSFGGTYSYSGSATCPGSYVVQDAYSWYQLAGVSNNERGFCDAGGHPPHTECSTSENSKNNEFDVVEETVGGHTVDMQAWGYIWKDYSLPENANSACVVGGHGHQGWATCSGHVNRVGSYITGCYVCGDRSKQVQVDVETRNAKCKSGTGIHKMQFRSTTGTRYCVHCPYIARDWYEGNCGRTLGNVNYKFNWGCTFVGDKPDGSGKFTDVVGDRTVNRINGTETVREVIQYGGSCTLTMELWNTNPSSNTISSYACIAEQAYWTKNGSTTPYQVGGVSGGLGGQDINYAGPNDETNGLHQYSITLTNVTESDNYYQFVIKMKDGTVIKSPRLYVDTTIIFFDYSHDDGVPNNELSYDKAFIIDDTGVLHNRDNKRPVANAYNILVESRALIPDKTYAYNDGSPEIGLPNPLLYFEYKLFPRTVGRSDQSIRSNNSFRNTGEDGVSTNNYKVVMPDDFVKRVFDYKSGSNTVSGSTLFDKTRYSSQSAVNGITYHSQNANGNRYEYQVFHTKRLDKWVLDTDLCQGHELIPYAAKGFTQANLKDKVITDSSTPNGVGVLGKHWGYAVYEQNTQAELGLPRPERYVNIRLVDGMTGDAITQDNISDDSWNTDRLDNATKYNDRVSGSSYSVGNYTNSVQTAIGGTYSAAASAIDNKGFPSNGIYLTYRFKFDGWYSNGSSGFTPVYHQHTDDCGKTYARHTHSASCYKGVTHVHTDECYQSVHLYHRGNETEGGDCYSATGATHTHSADTVSFANSDSYEFWYNGKKYASAIKDSRWTSGAPNISNENNVLVLDSTSDAALRTIGMSNTYIGVDFTFKLYSNSSLTSLIGTYTLELRIEYDSADTGETATKFTCASPSKINCFTKGSGNKYSVGCGFEEGKTYYAWKLTCDRIGQIETSSTPLCSYATGTMDTGDIVLDCDKEYDYDRFEWACGKTEKTIESYVKSDDNTGVFSLLKTDNQGRVSEGENLGAYAKWEVWDSAVEGSDFELPQVYKPGYTFLGWYTEPQYSTAKNNSNGWSFTEDIEADGMGNKANYAGGGYVASSFGAENGGDEKDCKFIESAVNMDASDNVITLYAWYNRTPVFVDVYEGQFFEGQMVTTDDLLSLISAFDVEGDYHNAALNYIYNLPEIDEMDVYFEVHLDENNDYHVNEDGIPVDANEKTIKYVKKDGKIFRVINDEAFDQDKEVVWIAGKAYQLKKEFEQVVTTTSSGEEVISWKNTSTDKQYWTVESKMKLESLVDQTTLTPIIESIQYEVTDGVPSSEWGNGTYCKVGEDGVENNWGRTVSNYYNRFDTKTCFDDIYSTVFDKELNNIDRDNYTSGAAYISARDSEIAAWRKGSDGQLVNKGLANRVILDTSSSRIDRSALSDRLPDSYKDAVGHFTITYKVTDGGIMCDGALIREHHDGANVNEGGTVDWDSKTTVKYTRECVIQYNNAPNIYVRNLSLFESDDDPLDTITISKVFENELVLDAEDCVDNPPWWYRYSQSENATSGNPTGEPTKTESGSFMYPGYLETVGNWVDKDKEIKYEGYTFNNLQATLFEVRLYDIKLSSWLAQEYKDSNIEQAVKEWEDTGIRLADLRALKNNSSEFRGTGVKCSEVYNAVLSYGLELDALDQFGKYASGRLPYEGKYTNPDPDPNYPDVPIEVDPFEDDEEGDPEDPDPDGNPEYHQPIPERTITIYKVNITHDDDMLQANVREYVRYISEKWLPSLIVGSYWEDDNYGGQNLQNIFDIYTRRWTEHNSASKEYSGSYQSPEHGNVVNITVKDYTE